MNTGFEQKLYQLRDIAQDSLQAENTPQQNEKIAQELEFITARYARSRESTQEAQQHIYHLQVEKQRVMQQLRADLQRLDQPNLSSGTETADPKKHTVTYRDGCYVVGTDNEAEISVGDILTDGEWGIAYHLDSTTVPRPVQKQYLVAEAKRELQKFVDWQIYFDQTSSRKTPNLLKGAYERHMEDQQLEREPKGIIIERLVRTFLKKLAIDYSLDFEVIESDVFEDITRKIDFIVHRTTDFRGVSVQEADHSFPEDVGIQFTVNQSPDVLEHKRQQIARSRERLRPQDLVKDIVLVLLSPETAAPIYEAYSYWQGSKPIGGPDKWWNENMKEKVFKSILQDIFTPQELEHQWEQIRVNL